MTKTPRVSDAEVEAARQLVKSYTWTVETDHDRRPVPYYRTSVTADERSIRLAEAINQKLTRAGCGCFEMHYPQDHPKYMTHRWIFVCKEHAARHGLTELFEGEKKQERKTGWWR